MRRRSERHWRTIVPVPRNHNRREQNEAIKAGDVPEAWRDKPAKRSQKDVEARWTKKHGQSHSGYRNHVNVDRKHKFVRRHHVTDAAVHDSQAVGELLMKDNTSREVRVDAACRSADPPRSKRHCRGAACAAGSTARAGATAP